MVVRRARCARSSAKAGEGEVGTRECVSLQKVTGEAVTKVNAARI